MNETTYKTLGEELVALYIKTTFTRENTEKYLCEKLVPSLKAEAISGKRYFAVKVHDIMCFSDGNGYCHLNESHFEEWRKIVRKWAKNNGISAHIKDCDDPNKDRPSPIPFNDWIVAFTW